MENKKKKAAPRQNQIVKIRRKELKSGETTLFLDIYYKGKRYYEFLNLRLVKGNTKINRDHNNNIELLAENIRSKRQLEISNGDYDFLPAFKKTIPLLDYFEKVMQKKKNSVSNFQNWQSTLKHLQKFDKGNVLISQINEDWLEDWHSYLKNVETKNEKKLSINTIFSYYNKIIACIKQAFKEKLTNFNPAQTSIGVKSEDSKREYLSADEVQKLINTNCDDPQLKRAFLFSCLTGLRWSDIEKLTWSEVREDMIMFKQKKTGAHEYLPVSEQALHFLGERKEETEKVFHLTYSAWNNVKLKDWARDAGIMKKVTFHVARHTMATMSLTNGADLYTVGKLLGHKNIKTTQIYTKVIDSKKRDAVDSMPKFLL